MSEWVKLIFQIIISVGAAFLAAHLAAKRFRDEKLWEKKVVAYSGLIDALHKMKWYESERGRAEARGIEISQDYDERLFHDYISAHAEVSRIAESSSLFISTKIMDIVTRMNNDLDKISNTAVEHSIISKCIEQVKEIGNRELGLRTKN